jgi:hypothetical protein
LTTIKKRTITTKTNITRNECMTKAKAEDVVGSGGTPARSRVPGHTAEDVKEGKERIHDEEAREGRGTRQKERSQDKDAETNVGRPSP